MIVPKQTISYIIPPDTPGFIKVTEPQLERLKKAKLLKQIGTRCVGADCEPILELTTEPVYEVSEGVRKSTMFLCYLID